MGGDSNSAARRAPPQSCFFVLINHSTPPKLASQPTNFTPNSLHAAPADPLRHLPSATKTSSTTMSEYRDDLYAQFEAAQRHQHWLHQQDKGAYSWSTILITGLTIFATLAYAGIIQTSPDRILSTAISFAMRASSRVASWLPGGGGLGARDGGALKTVFGLDSGSLRNLSPSGTAMRGFGNLLKGTASLDPPGLGNMSNSCYQNSIIQV